MSNDNTVQPIMVDATPGPAQLAAGIRQTILAIASILTTLGFSHAAGTVSLALQFVGPAAMVIVFVVGQLKTRHAAAKLATVAASASNAVAIVKPQ